MFFMVIEKFRKGEQKRIYQRFETRGRMLPDGLKFVDSWIDASFNSCFQLMECDDLCLMQAWIAKWNDLVDFEVIPIAPSKKTKEMMKQCSAT